MICLDHNLISQRSKYYEVLEYYIHTYSPTDANLGNPIIDVHCLIASTFPLHHLQCCWSS